MSQSVAVVDDGVQTEAVTADLFPPTAGTQPALSAEQWLAGADRHPILVSLIVSRFLVIVIEITSSSSSTQEHTENANSAKAAALSLSVISGWSRAKLLILLQSGR